jgi:hypothetical protein
MKKSLLATVATIALIAGHGIASAEGAPKQEAPAQKTEAPTPAPSAQQKAPAEKMAPADKGAQMKAPDAKADIKADGKAQTTTGQGSSDQKSSDTMKSQSGTQQKASDTAKPDASKNAAQPSSQRNATETKPDAAKSGSTAQSPAADSKSQTTGSAPSGSGAVSLTTEQKTQIRSTVLTSSAPRVTNVNFSINVGTVVPRTVRIVTVPDTIVRIHPAWRGYQYFVYNDEIIIVEPGTLRIIAVLVV